MASNACTFQNLTLLLMIIFIPIASPIAFNYPAVFNFGDSNSDTGNLVAGLGKRLDLPNGQTYFQKPSGRYCDGRLIIDFLMDAMDLPFLNPYLEATRAPSFRTGCNFAAAGSTTLPATASSQNLAKFGTDPSTLDELGCVISHNQVSRILNLQLHALCKKFQSQNPDSNVTYVDIFAIKSNLIANYSRYGFEQPLMACCGVGGPPLNYNRRIACGQTKILNGSSVTARACNDSTEYVNWDGIHYTEAANQHVSSQILTGKYSDPPFADKMPFLLKLKF